MGIPKTLEERLRRGKVIPFIGAGVSRAVKDKETGKRLFPSWKELLEKAADRLDAEQKGKDANLVRAFLDIDTPDYLEAAKHARKALGSIWFDFLREQLDHPREKVDDESLKLAEAMWKLGSHLLITTNYDRVLYWSHPQRDNLSIWDIEAPAEQGSALRDGVKRPTVWHLHGLIDNAADLILTPDGYERLYPEAGAETRYDAALETLKNLMASHTFLFIGFSMDDQHFGIQLQGLDRIFQNLTGPHYVLVHKAEFDQIRSRNLAVIPILFEDFGAPLLECLQELSRIATTSLDEADTFKDVGPTPPTTLRRLRVFLCHSSNDKPSVRDLYQRLRILNIDPWLDEEKLLPGQDWNQEITKAVQNSDIVIVCLSRGSISKSGYVQREVKYALDRADEQPDGAIFLVPLKLEECEVPNRLQRWHWVDYFTERGYEKLVKSLRAQANKLNLLPVYHMSPKE